MFTSPKYIDALHQIRCTWAQSWKAAQRVQMFAGTRTLCVRLPREAQAKPQPQARPHYTQQRCTCSSQAPCWGGGLQIKLKSPGRGVVVRDLKGRERAFGEDAEPPLGLQKCSRARQGGWGERHCLLNTGYRGVDVTFVNVHRRLYRTHPRQWATWCLSTYAHLRPALIPALCSESASSLAVSAFSKGLNTIASSASSTRSPT